MEMPTDVMVEAMVAHGTVWVARPFLSGYPPANWSLTAVSALRWPLCPLGRAGRRLEK